LSYPAEPSESAEVVPPPASQKDSKASTATATTATAAGSKTAAGGKTDKVSLHSVFVGEFSESFA